MDERQDAGSAPRRTLCTRIMVAALLALTGACAEMAGEGMADQGVDLAVATGVLQVRIAEDADGGTYHYGLLTPDARYVPLDFEINPGLRAGSELELWGTWEGDSLKVSTWEAQPLPKRLDGPMTRPAKNYRVAVLIAGTTSMTNAQAEDEMRQTNRFFTEVSAGRDTLTTAKVWRFPSLGDCPKNDNALIKKVSDAFQAAEGGLSNYDHIAVVVTKACLGWSGGSADMGYIRNDGSMQFGWSSIYSDDSFNAWWLGHELGHSLSLDHARSATCSGALYRPAFTNCKMDEYGDYNDPMGEGNLPYFNVPTQRHMGWIPAAQVVTAGGSGTFNLVSADAKQRCGIQGLRINVPNESGKYFYVEYRKARSDSLYAGTGIKPGTARGDAVLVTWAQHGASDWTNTVRIELGSSVYQGALAGQRYQLGQGVAVQVRSMGTQMAQVAVEAPGSGAHRDDSGSALPRQSDGSFGSTACGGAGPTPEPPPPTPNTGGITLPKTTVAVGEPIVVRYRRLPEGNRHWIGLFKAGAADRAYQDFFYLTDESGKVRFSGLPAGDYEARLYYSNTYNREMSLAFKVK